MNWHVLQFTVWNFLITEYCTVMQLSVHLLHNPIHWERYSGMFRNNLSGHVVTKYWGKGTNSLLPDVWLVVTVQRHSENTGTEFAMKESWGHLGIAISEVKKQETGEEVKGSWSKTPDLDKFCVIQCKVYWQKLKTNKTFSTILNCSCFTAGVWVIWLLHLPSSIYSPETWFNI